MIVGTFSTGRDLAATALKVLFALFPCFPVAAMTCWLFTGDGERKLDAAATGTSVPLLPVIEDTAIVGGTDRDDVSNKELEKFRCAGFDTSPPEGPWVLAGLLTLILAAAGE